MRRKLLIIAVLILPTLFAKGQNTPIKVRNFEFELSAGVTYGIDEFVGEKKLGSALALETRYNFPQQPVDIGLELYIGSAVRKYDQKDLSNRIASFTVYSDYNFNRGKKISPFAGFGIGVASCDVVVGDYGDTGGRLIASPRVGVEFLRHIRLTCYSKLCLNGYNHMGLSVGYAFGGGLKK